MQRDFRTYLLFSIFLHAVIVFVLFYSPVFHDQPKKVYKVTFVSLSKGEFGTNLKANVKKQKKLPSSTVREQKYAKKDLANDKTGQDLRSKKSKTKKTVKQKLSKKRTSDKGGINIKKRSTKKPILSSKSRINNALARIDNQLKQRKISIATNYDKSKDTGQSPDGGNSGVNVRQELIRYYSRVKRKISNRWSVSKKDYDGSLITKIAVRIDAKGNILRSSYRKTSGNGSFDASAMRAIRGAAPFPTPPAAIRNEALTEGFLIEFNPTRIR